jgi:hypothetical protein
VSREEAKALALLVAVAERLNDDTTIILNAVHNAIACLGYNSAYDDLVEAKDVLLSFSLLVSGLLLYGKKREVVGGAYNAQELLDADAWVSCVVRNTGD